MGVSAIELAMSSDFTQGLHELRTRIDTLDDTLIALLRERIAIIHDVAALKRAHTPAQCHIRSGREGAMHRRIYESFKGSDFPPSAALAIWRQIIGASTHLESPITIALPEAASSLREQAYAYFGRVVGILTTENTQASLNAIIMKQATIALLPPPSADAFDGWQQLAQHPALKVFAALPVVLSAQVSPVAYAVAAITPEPSGEDMTLLFCAKGEIPQEATLLAEKGSHVLASVAGFIEHPLSLGSFPTPIIDPSLR